MNQKQVGKVIAVTRRFIEVVLEDGSIHQGKLATRDLQACVGDLAVLRKSDSEEASSTHEWEAVVESIESRRNCLVRSYGRKTKQVGANVDLVLIVCAPLPLFNTVSTDRILAASYQQDIPCALIVNKIDQTEALNNSAELLETYRNIGLSLYQVSARESLGLDALHQLLSSPELSTVILAGVSGVGKSTLLNQLIPECSVRTREVSSKTGQGRQTTSQPRGYLYSTGRNSPLLLVDLPGIQNFGISHLEEAVVKDSFPEFRKLARECQFADCKHKEEPECKILEALASGELSPLRYRSYLDMLEELEAAREY